MAVNPSKSRIKLFQSCDMLVDVASGTRHATDPKRLRAHGYPQTRRVIAVMISLTSHLKLFEKHMKWCPGNNHMWHARFAPYQVHYFADIGLVFLYRVKSQGTRVSRMKIANTRRPVQVLGSKFDEYALPGESNRG